MLKGTAVCGGPPPSHRDPIALVCDIGYAGAAAPEEFRFDFEKGIRNVRHLPKGESTRGYVLTEIPYHLGRDQENRRVDTVTWSYPKFKLPE